MASAKIVVYKKGVVTANDPKDSAIKHVSKKVNVTPVGEE